MTMHEEDASASSEKAAQHKSEANGPVQEKEGKECHFSDSSSDESSSDDSSDSESDSEEELEGDERIMADRIAAIQAKFAAYSEKQAKDKVADVCTSIQDLSEEAAKIAIEICQGNELEAKQRLLIDGDFKASVIDMVREAEDRRILAESRDRKKRNSENGKNSNVPLPKGMVGIKGSMVGFKRNGEVRNKSCGLDNALAKLFALKKQKEQVSKESNAESVSIESSEKSDSQKVEVTTETKKKESRSNAILKAVSNIRAMNNEKDKLSQSDDDFEAVDKKQKKKKNVKKQSKLSDMLKSATTKFKVGTLVEALWEDDWLAATIIEVKDGPQFKVRWLSDSSLSDNVPLNEVREARKGVESTCAAAMSESANTLVASFATTSKNTTSKRVRKQVNLYAPPPAKISKPRTKKSKTKTDFNTSMTTTTEDKENSGKKNTETSKENSSEPVVSVEDLKSLGWSDARVKAYMRRQTNPNAYYYRFNDPGEVQKRGGWTSADHDNFMNLISKGVNYRWGLFSMNIPGRVGYQCSNYYRKLIIDGKISDPNYYIDEDGKLKFKFKKKANELKELQTSIGKGKGKTVKPSVHKNSEGLAVTILPTARAKIAQKNAEKASISRAARARMTERKAAAKRKAMENKNGKPKKKRKKRSRRTQHSDGSESDNEARQLTEKEMQSLVMPGFMDPMTAEQIFQPAISPHNIVMGYQTWMRCLNKKDSKNTCPFTKKTVTRRSLVKLTKENIEEYRSKIVNL